MASLNKVMLIGNVGQDPELRYTPDGNPVANFSIAVIEEEGLGKNIKMKQNGLILFVFQEQQKMLTIFNQGTESIC